MHRSAGNICIRKKTAAVAIRNPYPAFCPVALAAATLDAFAGKFRLNDKLTRTVRRDRDQHVVERAGRPVLAIYPLGDGSYFAKNALTA